MKNTYAKKLDIVERERERELYLIKLNISS